MIPALARLPRRVRLATLLAIAFHGLFVLSARYRLSYDAYNHMFFGDHYRLDWWSLWETRWYTGFPVTSYPPLVHQLIGLAGRAIGVDAAFGVLLWLVLSAYPAAVYAFSRVFCGRAAAGYAALVAALLPSIYQAAHTFGQLPTLTSGLCALFGLAALNEYLRHGRRLDGALTVALLTVMVAAHHATLLFLPFIVGALLLHLWLHASPTHQHRARLALRLLIAGAFSAGCMLLVVWPFWAWGRGQSMQTPIDHPSRHNFFLDPLAPAAFFLPVYGPLMALIPWVAWRGARRSTFGLWAAFVLLFVLGLGGTTPLPRLLFGPGWEWLTYDRFALWASLTLLPFAGLWLVLARRRLRAGSARRRALLPGALGLLGVSAALAGLLASILPTQPPQVDMQPIVAFLAADKRAEWRYVTFGLGDQLAYLSRLTPATTIDGSYHTARSLPELRASGIGQIDTTYWLPDGLARLEPVLKMAGQRGVRWGFVNRAEYVPILRHDGWVYLTTLSNQVQAWENPAAVLPPPVPIPAADPLEQFSWGVLPLLSLALALALGLLRLAPLFAQRALRGVHSFALGLLPLGLCLWYYRPLAAISIPRVYFTYSDALVYLPDGIAAAAVLAWGLARIFGPRSAPAARGPWLARPATWLVGLCLLATLSSAWSVEPRTSLVFSLQLWLAAGLALSLGEWPGAWRSLVIGAASALLAESAIGFWQAAAQNTSFLLPLGLNWPGSLTPASVGASVVELADGARWLRVYGTLPHPNILGGLVVVFLVIVAAGFLAAERLRPWLLLPFGAGLGLLVLTFSRSAWLAMGVFGLVVALRGRSFARKRLWLLLGVALVCGLAAALPLRGLVFARAGGASLRTEDFSSIARVWLAQQGWQFFLARPFGGWGAGAFILALAAQAPPGYIIEPVHNLPLLISSELGAGGALLLLGLVISLALGFARARRPVSIALGAALLGLGVIAMLDHYLWSLAPGRLLLGLAIGLFCGQLGLETGSETTKTPASSAETGV